MGWDASLVVTEEVDCPTCGKPGHTTLTEVHSANHTHNTAPMIYDVLERSNTEGVERYLVGRSWWDGLNGLSGAESLPFLSLLIAGLRADPKRYRGMNPANGWGNYDQLVSVLVEMRHAAQEHPEGEWQVGG